MMELRRRRRRIDAIPRRSRRSLRPYVSLYVAAVPIVAARLAKAVVGGVAVRTMTEQDSGHPAANAGVTSLPRSGPGLAESAAKSMAKARTNELGTG